MAKTIKEKYKNQYSRYTEKDRMFIEENWGVKSIGAISKQLHRSPSALIRYAENHKIGGSYVTNELLTLQDAADILGVNVSTIYKVWIENYNFPVISKRYNERLVKRVNIDKLRKWCEKNQDRFSAVNVERFALGEEPEWLVEKRKKDYYNSPLKQQWWDKESEAKLLRYAIQGLTNKEIGIKMNRSTSSVGNKRRRLVAAGKLKELSYEIQNNLKVSC